MQRNNNNLEPEAAKQDSRSQHEGAGRLSSISPLAASSLLQEGLSVQLWLDISPDALVVVNATGQIVLVNRQGETLFGYAREELVGQPLEVLLPKRLQAAHVHHREHYAALPHIRPMGVGLELYARRKDDTEVPIDISLSPLRFDDAFYVLAAVRDVTERKLLEQRAQMEQRKDDFISMASHELKTPLTSLTAYAGLLQRLLDRDNDGQANQYLTRMNIQLTKLTRLIADLLDISKVQAGKLVFAEEPVVIDDLVREEVEHFRPTVPHHRILIEGKTGGEVTGDRDRLGQVIVNLLSNAVKYSPQAEQIIVHLASTASEITVSIRDFGIGISEDHQKRIFERFYRVSTNREKQFAGLGVGLYISSEIILHHRGRIWVDSTEGAGSTFSFVLPLKSA
jgi:PAS domain S-box-containing protein